MKKFINIEELKHYLKYGPMDFTFKKALFYSCIIDLPMMILIYIISKLN